MQVTVYSTPTCPYCTQAKDFLTEQGVEFADINVQEDQEKARYMVEKSGQMGVPVIGIKKDEGAEEEMIVGFDKSQLAEKLGLSV